jgi:hypothetical protein
MLSSLWTRLTKLSCKRLIVDALILVSALILFGTRLLGMVVLVTVGLIMALNGQ